MSEYVPGSCNIGSAEIHRRYQVAIIGTILYLILAISYIAADISTAMRLTVFFPAMMASVGYNQARRKFCLAYGLMGVFSLDKLGNTTAIKDPNALAADRKYAFTILAMSLIPALLLTGFVLIL